MKYMIIMGVPFEASNDEEAQVKADEISLILKDQIDLPVGIMTDPSLMIGEELRYPKDERVHL